MKKLGPNVNWFGQEVTKVVVDHEKAMLDIAAIKLTNDISTHFGDSSRRTFKPNMKRVSGQSDINRQYKSWKKRQHSKPGEAPFIQTGFLKNNVTWSAPLPLARLIGTGIGNKESVGYAAWLELGTTKMKPRPWLRPALTRNARMVATTLGTPIGTVPIVTPGID